MTFALDWRATIDPVISSLTLVRDGRIVRSVGVARDDDLSVGNAESLFVPLHACHVELRRRDVAGYLRRFRSGRILIDQIPDVPFDDRFSVALPAYVESVTHRPRAKAIATIVENRIQTTLRRMFPRDSFDVRVDDSTSFPLSFVDASGAEIRTNGGANIVEDRSHIVHFTDLTIRASNVSFYRRVRARRHELDRLSGEPDLEHALAPTIAALERSHPHARMPIALDAPFAQRDAAGEVGAWTPQVETETYWVKRPPC